MRPFPLAQQVDGINLARQKGGASPSGLVELLNGFVNKNGIIESRGGLQAAKTFPAGTIGVVGFENKFHTFAAVPVANSDPEIVVNVLRHPTGGAAGLLKIHSAEPFLAKLYVVAEFTDNVVEHYWLDLPEAWTSATGKLLGARVQPLVQNGYYYANKTQNLTDPIWTANNEVSVGVFRQPTTQNSFKYEVTATSGVAPIRTSNTEPTWPTVAGATVIERRFVTEAQSDPGSAVPPEESTNDPIIGSEDDEFYPFGRGKGGLTPEDFEL